MLFYSFIYFLQYGHLDVWQSYYLSSLQDIQFPQTIPFSITFQIITAVVVVVIVIVVLVITVIVVVVVVLTPSVLEHTFIIIFGCD